jgi:hypothetical protein
MTEANEEADRIVLLAPANIYPESTAETYQRGALQRLIIDQLPDGGLFIRVSL